MLQYPSSLGWALLTMDSINLFGPPHVFLGRCKTNAKVEDSPSWHLNVSATIGNAVVHCLTTGIVPLCVRQTCRRTRGDDEGARWEGEGAGDTNNNSNDAGARKRVRNLLGSSMIQRL